jgi:holliday junction DNA helicase RuvA
MIAQLTGRLAHAGLGDLVLDVGGVGYHVLVAPGTVREPVGAQVTLHTHLAVREDAMTLYGFPDPGAKAVFTTLLGVTGVGPKLALAAIGTLGADGLRRAVIAEDVAALTVVPGVGKKGAQRMILELRERLGAAGDGVPGGSPGATDARGEVREALGSLGYAAAEVQAALDALPGDPAASPEDLLREALRTLGRR